MAAGKQGMVPADIGSMVDAGDVRLSPDGRTAACAVVSVDVEANEYRSRIWLVPVDGGGARPVTAGERRDARPRWSPDGTRLAFVSHREDTGSQLYVLPLTGGEPARVATCVEEIEDVAWSPDGTRLAFTARVRDERTYGPDKAKDRPARRLTRLYSRLDGAGWTHDRPRHVHVVDAAGAGEPVQLTSGDREFVAPAWRPDGDALVAVAALHDDWDLRRASDLVLLDAHDPSVPPRPLTGNDAVHALPSWSPDGTVIACYHQEATTAPRDFHVAVVPAAGGAATVIGGLDRQCTPHGAARAPVWADGRLVFAVEDAGNIHVYAADPASPGSAAELLVGGTVAVTAVDATAGTVAVTARTPTRLGEVYAVDGDGPDGLRRLTSFAEAFTASVEVSEPVPFTATSADGTEVPAWFVPPVGVAEGARCPAVLNIHGGPYTQYGNQFFDEFQLQAGAGFGVVYANPRGSSGYGEAWGRAIRGPLADVDPGSGWGGVDHDDLMAVVDEAVRRFPVIDPARLGVMGGSYGGYMTSWIIGHTDRFAAAISERAVNNVLTLESTSDIASVFSRQIGVSHLDHPEEYLRISPITHVRSITTPTLILHSEDDLRCPIEQAEQLFVALRLLGRDVEFVRFPGEGHELSRSGAPKHRIERAETVLGWLSRWLS